MSAALALLGPRYKALAALLVPLIGGVLFLMSTNELDIKHLAGIVAVALGSGGLAHQVPNVVTTATDTVDTVADDVTGVVGDVLGDLP